MIIAISSWFNEPDIEFRISFKVHNVVWKYLTDDIMKPFGLEENDPGFLMRLVTATSSDTKKLDVRGPEINKRNKSISYGLWLPYENINGSADYLKEYLYYYFNALVIVFNVYGVSEASIREIQDKVEAEVLNNTVYLYEN